MSVLLSVLLTGLLVWHYAFRCVSLPVIEKLEGVIKKSISQERPDRERNANKAARVFIPNMLSKWPWSRRLNPHYAEIEKEVTAWMADFNAFSPKAQIALERCKPSLLACLAYPNASKEHARAGCDLMYLAFVYDEYSDRSTPAEVREQKNVIMDALQNPHKPRPEGEWVGGELTRQFWERTTRGATPVWQRRFIHAMDMTMEAIVQESIDKRDGRIPDVKTYIELRRNTSGLRIAFCIYDLGLDIPDEVMSHPIIQEMSLAANDLISFSNDIYSYNMEQTRGEDLHNMITCVMKEYDTDVNGAILWVEQYLSRAEGRFHAARDALPEWEEPLNLQVKAYCDGLGQWVRANREWSFESERYFGNKGVEIKECGLMSLLSKDSYSGAEIGLVYVDSSLL